MSRRFSADETRRRVDFIISVLSQEGRMTCAAIAEKMREAGWPKEHGRSVRGSIIKPVQEEKIIPRREGREVTYELPPPAPQGAVTTAPQDSGAPSQPAEPSVEAAADGPVEANGGDPAAMEGDPPQPPDEPSLVPLTRTAIPSLNAALHWLSDPSVIKALGHLPDLSAERHDIVIKIRDMLQILRNADGDPSEVLIVGDNGRGKSFIINLLLFLTAVSASTYRSWHGSARELEAIEYYQQRKANVEYNSVTLDVEVMRAGDDEAFQAWLTADNVESQQATPRIDPRYSTEELGLSLEAYLDPERRSLAAVEPYLLPSRMGGVITTPVVTNIRWGQTWHLYVETFTEVELLDRAFMHITDVKELMEKEKSYGTPNTPVIGLSFSSNDHRVHRTWFQCIMLPDYHQRFQTFTSIDQLPSTADELQQHFDPEVLRRCGKVNIYAGAGEDMDADRLYVARKLAEMFVDEGEQGMDQAAAGDSDEDVDGDTEEFVDESADEDVDKKRTGKADDRSKSSGKRDEMLRMAARDRESALLKNVTCFAPCRVVRNVVLMDSPGSNDGNYERQRVLADALASEALHAVLCVLPKDLEASDSVKGFLKDSAFLKSLACHPGSRRLVFLQYVEKDMELDKWIQLTEGKTTALDAISKRSKRSTEKHIQEMLREAAMAPRTPAECGVQVLPVQPTLFAALQCADPGQIAHFFSRAVQHGDETAQEVCERMMVYTHCYELMGLPELLSLQARLQPLMDFEPQLDRFAQKLSDFASGAIPHSVAAAAPGIVGSRGTVSLRQCAEAFHYERGSPKLRSHATKELWKSVQRDLMAPMHAACKAFEQRANDLELKIKLSTADKKNLQSRLAHVWNEHKEKLTWALLAPAVCGKYRNGFFAPIVKTIKMVINPVLQNYLDLLSKLVVDFVHQDLYSVLAGVFGRRFGADGALVHELPRVYREADIAPRLIAMLRQTMCKITSTRIADCDTVYDSIFPKCLVVPMQKALRKARDFPDVTDGIEDFGNALPDIVEEAFSSVIERMSDTFLRNFTSSPPPAKYPKYLNPAGPTTSHSDHPMSLKKAFFQCCAKLSESSIEPHKLQAYANAAREAINLALAEARTFKDAVAARPGLEMSQHVKEFFLEAKAYEMIVRQRVYQRLARVRWLASPLSAIRSALATATAPPLPTTLTPLNITSSDWAAFVCDANVVGQDSQVLAVNALNAQLPRGLAVEAPAPDRDCLLRIMTRGLASAEHYAETLAMLRLTVCDRILRRDAGQPLPFGLSHTAFADHQCGPNSWSDLVCLVELAQALAVDVCLWVINTPQPLLVRGSAPGAPVARVLHIALVGVSDASVLEGGVPKLVFAAVTQQARPSSAHTKKAAKRRKTEETV
eukprot:m.126374 g.126374  ORF g.126374 m.126374 type:complete len:1372 (+) comp9389_c0_seq7:1070-5185(+)